MLKKKQAKKKINVGGQAVIEGVMMRSPHYYSVAVRRKNGKIEMKSKRLISAAEKHKWLKWPGIRGILVLIESMQVGFNALDFASSVYEKDYEENSKKEKKKGKRKKKKLLKKKDRERKEKAEFAVTMVVSVVIALGLFAALPWALTHFVEAKFKAAEGRVVFNSVIILFKLMIFLLYVWIISFLGDIKRVFQYHGAEHKSIYAYENSKKLTYENIKKYSTLHARCGTSFIALLFLISLVVFILLLPPGLNLIQRLAFESSLIIPIAGISYEFLKLSDRFRDNPAVKLFILPGLGFQKITTKEPDKKQIEVAAKALLKVLSLEKKSKKKKK